MLPSRDQVADLLNVNHKWMIPFDVEDPLNVPNRLKGFLCRKPDRRYGALVILSVNNRPVDPQIVFAVPKICYPFVVDDDDRMTWIWPKEVEETRLYTKWDGTSVFVYSYADADGGRYVTAKLRLHPVIRNGSFGPFLEKWCKQTANIRWPRKVLDGTMGLAFEMYGYENPLLMQYPFPMKLSLLFCVTRNGDVLPPENAPFFDGVGDVSNPLVTMTSTTDRGLADYYERTQTDFRARNQSSSDGCFIGSEGFVFYVYGRNGTGVYQWSMWKCKDPAIEEIHRKAARAPMISRNIVRATAWNALETVDIDDLSVAVVSDLLAEEFSTRHIQANEGLIGRVVSDIRETLAFRAKVKNEYAKLPEGLPRVETLRALARVFESWQMKQVYLALKAERLVD